MIKNEPFHIERSDRNSDMLMNEGLKSDPVSFMWACKPFLNAPSFLSCESVKAMTENKMLAHTLLFLNYDQSTVNVSIMPQFSVTTE